LQGVAVITRNERRARRKQALSSSWIGGKRTREKPDPLTMSEKQLAEAHRGLARKPPAGKRDLTLRH